jgi:hypothetical protein
VYHRVTLSSPSEGDKLPRRRTGTWAPPRLTGKLIFRLLFPPLSSHDTCSASYQVSVLVSQNIQTLGQSRVQIMIVMARGWCNLFTSLPRPASTWMASVQPRESRRDDVYDPVCGGRRSRVYCCGCGRRSKPPAVRRRSAWGTCGTAQPTQYVLAGCCSRSLVRLRAEGLSS